MKRRSVRINPGFEERDLKGRYRRHCGSIFMFVIMKKINLLTSKVKRKLLLHNIISLLKRT